MAPIWWWLTLLLSIGVVVPQVRPASQSTPVPQCHIDVEEQPARYFSFDNRPIDLILETSDRLTHQLSTQVFAIFLRQALGYVGVKVAPPRRDAFNVHAVLKRLTPNYSGGDNDTEGFIPETMINLEVWVPIGSNLKDPDIASGGLDECGILGPGGRFGWFMPEAIADRSPTANHWRSLRDPDFAATFELDAKEMDWLAQFTQDANGSYYCNESFCEGGVFWPDQCRPRRHERSARPCAVLLAEYPDYMTFLPAQIQQLGLLVKVIWLGPHTDHVVREFLDKEDRLEQGKSVLFFAWRPSNITESRKFVSVLFPQCETRGGHQAAAAGGLAAADEPTSMNCAYEFQRFEKFAWSHVSKGAKLAYEVGHAHLPS